MVFVFVLYKYGIETLHTRADLRRAMGTCWSKTSRFSYDMNKRDGTVAAQQHETQDSPGNGVGPVSNQNIARTPPPSESEDKEGEGKEAITNEQRDPELLDCNLTVTVEEEWQGKVATKLDTAGEDAGNSSDGAGERSSVQDGGELVDDDDFKTKTKSSKDVIVLEENNHIVAEIGDDIKEMSIQQSSKQSNSEQEDQGLDFKRGHVGHSGKEEVKIGHAKTTASTAELHRFLSDEDIAETVRKCWGDIERSCGSKQGKKAPVSTISPTGWRVVRLFVSSTFADYHAEREVLVKKVFPELREWCESRHLHFIESDLRWGVPKDSTTEATIRTCLGEVDRCSAETNGMPFFLNMLGERYGWMPSLSHVPEEVVEQYQWIFPCSITHMEILHAAYRTQNPNSLFFLRKADFLAALPTQMEKGFIDSLPLAKEQLKTLKEKLKKWFPGQVFEYTCEYDGIDDSTGRPKVQLRGLDDFCSKALEYLKTAIERTYPEIEKELSPEEIELAMHDNFIQLRGQLVLGRDSEISKLVEFARTGKFPNKAEDAAAEGHSPVMVVGLPGFGKSSVMARCVQEVRKLDCSMFYHFIGSGAGSTDSFALATRLCKWLKRCITPEQQETLSNEEEELTFGAAVEKVEELMQELGKNEEEFVIIIDALNQLSDLEDTGHLRWLPASIPGNVRCILSMVKDSRSEYILLDKYSSTPPSELPIAGLDEKARQEIAIHSLGKFNKKLDEEQLELLVSAPGALNPLWLSLSCEELRVFGVFEKVTEHIRKFPEELKGLLQFILNRFINEDETGNIRKVLCLLACSENGLSETELMWLLSDSKNEPLPMMLWADCRRLLKPFLRNTGKLGTEEKLDFFHASIQEVVDESIIQENEEEKKWRLVVADYFENVSKDDPRTTSELPYQLQKAKENNRLFNFMRKDWRGIKMNPLAKNKFFKPMRCRQMTVANPQFTSEVVICQFCEFGQRNFGQLAGRNVDCCIICGQMVHRKDDRSIGKLCNRHKPFTAPGMGKCFVCAKHIHFKMPQLKWSKGYLCHICSPGANTCVHLDV